MKEKFKKWMFDTQNLKSVSVEKYIGALNTIGKDLKPKVDVYSVTNLDSVLFLRKRFQADTNLQQKNSQGNNMYSCALNHYINFIKSQNSLKKREQKVEVFIEGDPKTISHLDYERDRRVREKCLQHHGYSCKICQCNLGQIYGEKFQSIIEVHHIKPLAEMKSAHIVNPITDVVPLCPNCHRVVHSDKHKPLSLNYVKTIIKC